VSGAQSRGRYVQDMTISFSFHLFKTTKGQMAIDMLIVRQSMMRLIPTMNKTYIKPLNYYTAVVIKFTLHN